MRKGRVETFMTVTPATEQNPHTAGYRLRVLASFFAIYILWGTTFLGIRVAVEEMPPVFASSVTIYVENLLSNVIDKIIHYR